MPIILIVDDAIENVRLLKNLLQDFGEVVFARDGLEALQQAARSRPDLVLLDVMMPGLDGYETCRRLKAEPQSRDTPVIFITGADAESDEEKGLALGAIDYITKPFAPAIVRARVQNHLALIRATNDLRRANDALRKYKAAVDCSSAAIVITDREARIEYANRAFGEVGGDLGTTSHGTPINFKAGARFADPEELLWQRIIAGNNWRGETEDTRPDGTTVWEDVSIAPVRDDTGTITHVVAVTADITPRKQLEAELRRLAITDPLTGLANRRRLMEQGSQELLRAARSGDAVCALMLDIDHFKRINDNYGHPAGDAVIQAVARICTEHVRVIDTVGRLGGEEFAVLLPMTAQGGAVELAERLRASIAATTVVWERQPISFTISIGVAQSADSDADFAALLGRADQALYRAKEGGRNRVAVLPASAHA